MKAEGGSRKGGRMGSAPNIGGLNRTFCSSEFRIPTAHFDPSFLPTSAFPPPTSST